MSALRYPCLSNYLATSRVPTIVEIVITAAVNNAPSRKLKNSEFVDQFLSRYFK